MKQGNRTLISENIKQAVNIHGELHLDKIFTQLLIGWLEAQEKADKEMSDLVHRLKQTLTQEEK